MSDQLQLILDRVPAAVAVLDLDLRYVAVSRRFLVDYGVSDQPVIGRRLLEVFPDAPDR